MASVAYLIEELDQLIADGGFEDWTFCTGFFSTSEGELVPTGEIFESLVTVEIPLVFGPAARQPGNQAAMSVTEQDVVTPVASYDWETVTHIAIRKSGLSQVIDVRPLGLPITVLTGARGRIPTGSGAVVLF